MPVCQTLLINVLIQTIQNYCIFFCCAATKWLWRSLLNVVNGMEAPKTDTLHIGLTFHPQTLFMNYWELSL